MPSDELRERVLWEESPPEDRRVFIPILSPKVGSTLRLLVVSDRMVGVYTHFIANRTKPCTGKDGGCEGCQLGLARRWKGYLGVWLEVASRYALAEVTHQAAADNRALLADGGKSLRGKVLVLTRIGRARNSPVKAELQESRIKSDNVPLDFDVKGALLRVWERRPEDMREEKRLKGDEHGEDSETPEAG